MIDHAERLEIRHYPFCACWGEGVIHHHPGCPVLREFERLQAQLAEARKDAERYRWIRDNNAVDWEGGGLEVPADAPNEVWDVYELMIDAAVDAALAKHKEQT